jgi:hypothetical protein
VNGIDGTRPRPLAAVAEEIAAASLEVDLTLLRWFASLSLRDRLRAATRGARGLARFRDTPVSE